MLADAFLERAATEPYNWRRAGAAVGVAFLHLLFLYVLLHAVTVFVAPKMLKQVPVTIWLPQPPKKNLEEKKPLPPPPVEARSVEPKTAPITIPNVPAARPHSDEDGMGRLGHYLNNCGAANYSALSEQEWANCLGGMATRDGKTITLGQLKTLWEMQHPPKAPANPREATGFGECAHDDPRRLMGLPCFQHNGDKPSVLNGQQ
jgi:hypothetical protein